MSFFESYLLIIRDLPPEINQKPPGNEDRKRSPPPFEKGGRLWYHGKKSKGRAGVGMRVLVIDAQGGGMGKQLVAAIRQGVPGTEITAVGTNSAATAAMRKAGADFSATGENAVVVGCRRADVIVGPVGITIADALLGEITPAMAVAVGQSGAKRVLIPFNHCDNIVVGVSNLSIGALIQETVAILRDLADRRC
jgi:hypothetical protein